MKIRSYKGPSLEKLYETIQRELGPEAVVVRPDQPSGLGRFLSLPQHQLIAVVDDSAADAHLHSGSMKSEEISKIASRHEEKWLETRAMLSDLKEEIRSFSKTTNVTKFPECGPVPDFAMDWDPKFTTMVKSQFPTLLKQTVPDTMTRNSISSLLKTEEFFPAKEKAPRAAPHVVVITGPTGSGKTTTMAKLAANWSMKKNLKVGLITLDTYRVAAVDQTREYATLLGLDLIVAFSASEAARAMEYFADKDVVIVDTPGRNCTDASAMAQLKGVVQSLGPATNMLVIPATLDQRNICKLLQCFKVLAPNYLIITKVDETCHFSAFTTVAAVAPVPIAFITNGQRVPQDIYPASAAGISDMLINNNVYLEAVAN